MLALSITYNGRNRRGTKTSPEGRRHFIYPIRRVVGDFYAQLRGVQCIYSKGRDFEVANFRLKKGEDEMYVNFIKCLGAYNFYISFKLWIKLLL